MSGTSVSLMRRVATQPKRYIALPLQWLARVLTQSAFYLQGRMGIDPRSRWYKPEFVATTGGFFPPNESTVRTIVDLEHWDSTRRDMLVLQLRSVLTRKVPGDFAELGVYRGSTARLIHQYAPERVLHLFDTFEGFDQADVSKELATTGHDAGSGTFADTSLPAVLRYVGEPRNTVCAYVGRFPDSVPSGLVSATFAFVHLDADLYPPTLAGLEFFYPRMSAGGVIVLHDYNAWPGARAAVDTFFADKPETPVPMPDVSGSAVIVKL